MPRLQVTYIHPTIFSMGFLLSFVAVGKRISTPIFHFADRCRNGGKGELRMEVKLVCGLERRRLI